MTQQRNALEYARTEFITRMEYGSLVRVYPAYYTDQRCNVYGVRFSETKTK